MTTIHTTTTIHIRQLTTIHTRHLKIQQVEKVNNTKIRKYVFDSAFFTHLKNCTSENLNLLLVVNTVVKI